MGVKLFFYSLRLKQYTSMKKILINILSKAGYTIIRRSKLSFSVGDYQYDQITPYADYAPWLQDKEFMKIYSRIKDYTLVDIYRCYELWQMVENIHAIYPSVSFLEVGVWKGGTSGIIGRKLALLDSTNNFYLADTFSGVVKATEKDAFYKGGEHADTAMEIAEGIIKSVYRNYKILKGIFPNDTAAIISKEERFGLCHIDVDVYQSAKDIVDWIWDRMIIGGAIVFDDYGFHTCTGITKYVNEQKEKSDRAVIYNLNGHAIIFKLS